MNSKWFQEEFSQNLEISDSNSNDSDVEIIGANFNVNDDNVSASKTYSQKERRRVQWIKKCRIQVTPKIDKEFVTVREILLAFLLALCGFCLVDGAEN